MCGRYMLTSPVDALRQLFAFEQRPNLMPRYNIAPTQEVPIVRLSREGTAREGARELIMARWGLVPFWADDLAIGSRMINARRETVQSARAFREAFRRRRCLVPADGFFEWRTDGKARQPFLIRRQDRAPFAFAGLWERWRPPGSPASDNSVVRSCTIVTCPANELVAPLHERMPVILPPGAWSPWLDPDTDNPGSLLQTHPSDGFEHYPVNPRVNSPKNDDPDCIEPVVQKSLAL